jgi:hypothetical protein
VLTEVILLFIRYTTGCIILKLKKNKKSAQFFLWRLPVPGPSELTVMMGQVSSVHPKPRQCNSRYAISFFDVDHEITWGNAHQNMNVQKCPKSEDCVEKMRKAYILNIYKNWKGLLKWRTYIFKIHSSEILVYMNR